MNLSTALGERVSERASALQVLFALPPSHRCALHLFSGWLQFRHNHFVKIIILFVTVRTRNIWLNGSVPGRLPYHTLAWKTLNGKGSLRSLWAVMRSPAATAGAAAIVAVTANPPPSAERSIQVSHDLACKELNCMSSVLNCSEQRPSEEAKCDSGWENPPSGQKPGADPGSRGRSSALTNYMR